MAQNETAIKPAQKVSAKEKVAKIRQFGFPFFSKYRLANPVNERIMSIGKNDQFQATIIGS